MSSLDNLPLTNERLVASENSAFYEVDDEDREFISSGVFSTNVSNRYYIK